MEEERRERRGDQRRKLTQKRTVFLGEKRRSQLFLVFFLTLERERIL